MARAKRTKQRDPDVRDQAVAAVEAKIKATTQEETAAALGVSLSAVSRWHRKVRQPTRNQARRIIAVLGSK